MRRGLEPNYEQISHTSTTRLMLVTALAPIIGYDKSAEVAKKAHKGTDHASRGHDLLGFLSGEEFDAAVVPKT